MAAFLMVAGFSSACWGALVMFFAIGGIHEVYGSICILGGLALMGQGSLLELAVRRTSAVEEMNRRSEKAAGKIDQLPGLVSRVAKATEQTNQLLKG